MELPPLRAKAGAEATITMKKTQGPFSTIPEALDDIRRGRMVVVVDDEDRENEGDDVFELWQPARRR